MFKQNKVFALLKIISKQNQRNGTSRQCEINFNLAEKHHQRALTQYVKTHVFPVETNMMYNMSIFNSNIWLNVALAYPKLQAVTHTDTINRGSQIALYLRA